MKFNSGKKPTPFGFDFEKAETIVRENGRLVFTAVFFTVCLMFLAGLAAFFISVKSPEKVMVPDVVGKELTAALQEMQVKELYPKIRLRYSDSPEEKGTILAQSPAGGIIVKAGQRIALTVSQGVVADRVEDYVGKKLDDVRIHLQTLFASTAVPMIKLPDSPIYQKDDSEAGTILDQNPPPNTVLTRPITMELVVSSGPGNKEVPIPDITGLPLNDVLLYMSRSDIIFDFTAQPPEAGQAPGTVVSLNIPAGKTSATAYSRIQAVIALPDEPQGNSVYGLIDETLPPYPYALRVELRAEPPQAKAYSIVAFKHTGKHLTIPYAVPRNTLLVLSVENKEIKRFTVN